MLVLFATLLFAGCLLGVLRIRRVVWSLTLRPAWCFGIVALIGHGTAVCLSLAEPHVAIRTVTFVHFLAATLLLAPPVTVLGARRPGAAAWPWFVTLPMLLVLLWPAANEAIQTTATRPIQPGTPALLGVIVVLIMATGNYFGTRNTLACCCYAAGVLCHLGPAAGWINDPVTASLTAATMLCLSVTIAQFNITRAVAADSVSVAQAANRMWAAFRDLFGIVWAKRVADRVNQFGQREAWTVRLTLDGFTAWNPASKPTRTDSNTAASNPTQACLKDQLDTLQLSRPLEVLCWVLRRFADRDWFAAQLGEYFVGVPDVIPPPESSTRD
jgi:hypothetical protein